MATDKKWYPISDEGFNDIRISLARISAIGNFIANIEPDSICEPKQFYADMGTILDEEADSIGRTMDTMEADQLEKEKTKKDEEEAENREGKSWFETFPVAFKALKMRGFDVQRVCADAMAGTLKDWKEYKGNGDQAVEGAAA